MKNTILFLAFAFVGSSCRTLPNLSADEIHSRTAVLGVAITADALGIKATDAYLTAESAQWGVSFPGFDHVTNTKNYKQRRKPEVAPKSSPQP